MVAITSMLSGMTQHRCQTPMPKCGVMRVGQNYRDGQEAEALKALPFQPTQPGTFRFRRTDNCVVF
jgi:hypothetical protein